MNSLSEQVEDILKNIDTNKENLKQIAVYEETISKLQHFVNLEKPEYNLPLVDTIGKQTYILLNKSKVIKENYWFNIYLIDKPVSLH